MKSVTLVSVLVILSVVAACGPSTPTATPTPQPTPTPVEEIADQVDDLVGIWTFHEGRDYVEFLADGTMRVADTLEELQKNTPWLTGTFWFEGTVFNEMDTWCEDKGTYEVRLVREGGETVALRWKVIEDSCGDRRDAYRGRTLRLTNQ